MLLLLFPALAAPLVSSVGDEVGVGPGGSWARTSPNGDGTWDFLWAAGGDYNLLPMGEDLTVDDRSRTYLTGRDDLVDHAIARCPDGTWLHVASGNLDSPDDSAWAFRYDADFTLLYAGTVEERVTERAHNDMAIVCSPDVQGVAFWNPTRNLIELFPIGADATPGEPVPLEQSPMLTGGSLVWEPETDTIVALNFDHSGAFRLARYDTDLQLLETWTRELVDPPLRGYWAQAVLRVGDKWLLGHMARDDSQGWSGDTGDAWLQVFDLDWNVEESWQVSHNTSPSGGMRPGLARDGDLLLYTYDRDVAPRLFPVTLDADAIGPAPDTGATGDDDGDPTGGVPPTTDGGCGCASGAPVTGAAWLLGVVALARRRQDGAFARPRTSSWKVISSRLRTAPRKAE